MYHFRLFTVIYLCRNNRIFRYGPAATNKSRRQKANRASAGGTYCLQPLGPLFFYQIFFDPDMQLMQLSERNR